jgi:small subunit ribosomal protein S5
MEEVKENIAAPETEKAQTSAPVAPETKAAPAAGAKPAHHGGVGSNAGKSSSFGGYGNDRKSHDRDHNQHGRTPIQKEYDEKVVSITRVSKTVKGGRRIRFSALVVIGNGKGKYGYGIGKSLEVPDAIKKALGVAQSNLQALPIVKNDTIPHTIIGEFGACKVFLKPAPAGTGVVAGGPVRAILELAGIKNVYSKIYGSRSSINVIKATVLGLKQLRTISLAKQLLGEEAKAKEAK